MVPLTIFPKVLFYFFSISLISLTEIFMLSSIDQSNQCWLFMCPIIFFFFLLLIPVTSLYVSFSHYLFCKLSSRISFSVTFTVVHLLQPLSMGGHQTPLDVSTSWYIVRLQLSFICGHVIYNRFMYSSQLLLVVIQKNVYSS